jgi:hypothetical protein
MSAWLVGAALLVAASLAGPSPAAAQVFYVATTGDDTSGDGSAGNPWATITQALDTVPDGSTVLVRPGDYVGRVRLRRVFSTGVVVRSEVPYQARLRNSDRVITSNEAPTRSITIEGFDIAHSGPGATPLVVHIDGQGRWGPSATSCSGTTCSTTATTTTS